MADYSAVPGTQRTAKRWDNELEKIDIVKQSKELNEPLLKDFMRDSMHYKPEALNANADYFQKHEGRMVHGYPGTAWLQLGLLYGVGLYTAREQGIVSKSVIFPRFWKFHYFDWITFLRRGGVYAWAGGLVAGTVLFGSPDISIRRAISRYHCWVSQE